MDIKIERNIDNHCESCMDDHKVDLIQIKYGDGKLKIIKLCRNCQESLMVSLLDNLGTVGDK